MSRIVKLPFTSHWIGNLEPNGVMWAMDGLTTDPTFSDTPMVWNRAALNNVNTLTACSDLKSLEQ